MKISNRVYDVGKWISFIFLPSLTVFIGGIGELYDWNQTNNITTIINLFAVFLGSILQISSQKYQTISGGG